MSCCKPIQPQEIKKNDPMKTYGITNEELLEEVQALREELDSSHQIYLNDTFSNIESADNLVVAETQYHRLFETAKDGILILDAENGMIVDVNPFLIKLLGYSKADFMKKAIWEIGFLSDVIANHENFLKLKRTGYIRYDDLPLETKYGHTVNVEFVSNVYLVNNHKVIQCNIRDITDRKKMEKQQKLFSVILQILNKQNEWRNLIMHVLKEIKSYTGFDVVGIRLNGNTEEDPFFFQYGFNESCEKGENYFCTLSLKGSVDHDPAGLPVHECPCDIVTSGRTDAGKPYYTGGGSFWTNQSADLLNFIPIEDIRHNPGKICIHSGFVSLALLPIQSGEKIIGLLLLGDTHPDRLNPGLIEFYENLAMAIGTAYDRIHLEEKIKESEEKFRSYIEHSPLGIYVVNDRGNYVDCNQRAHEMLGYSREELLSLSIPKIMPAVEVEKGINNFKEVSERGFAKVEIDLLRKDKSTVPVLLEAVRLTGRNMFLAFCTDINDLKLTEKALLIEKEHAEESDRLKSSFLANMSHEIRTPLNSILGFSELLKESGLSGKNQQKYISLIEKSGIRMLNTINDIVDISRIESGFSEINISETNINEQNENILSFFRPEAEMKGLKLCLKNSLSSKESIIRTDSAKVYSILTNLIKNALKFTRTGFVVFGYKKIDKDLEFFVKDTGVGIRMEQKKIIFNRFRQCEEGYSRGHEGSGLGLAISKAYVEMLGGRLWVESETGKGSVFYFTIPCNGLPNGKDQSKLLNTPAFRENNPKSFSC